MCRAVPCLPHLTACLALPFLQVGKNHTASECAAILAAVDADGDGKLSFDEFEQIFRLPPEALKGSAFDLDARAASAPPSPPPSPPAASPAAKKDVSCDSTESGGEEYEDKGGKDEDKSASPGGKAARAARKARRSVRKRRSYNSGP